MVQEIEKQNLGDIALILQKYVQHMNDPFTTLDGQMKWFSSGLSKGTLYILAEYSPEGEVVGLLVHGTRNNRTAMIFANHDFRI